MKIIIVGADKTGTTLAYSLAGEGHDVTVIDLNAERVNSVCENSDVLGMVGNGLNFSALTEAGIQKTDLLIAMTGSDEQNLLCSLFAKKSEDCATIARLRNPLYLNETAFIKDQIGLSMVINPELAAATEISRLLRFPSAIDINSFCKGQLDLVTFRIPENSVLAGKSLTQLRGRINTDFLFSCVKRQDEFHIPTGLFELKEGDKVSVVIDPRNTQKFFRQIKLDTQSAKSVIIAGGGTLAFYLARQLLNDRIAVKIIETDEQRCQELSEKLPGAMIIRGDASDKSLLQEEGIGSTDAFLALTGYDEENVMLSLYAKELKCPKVITKVERSVFNDIISKLDLDSVIYPHSITTEHILQYARARQNAMGNNVETLYRLAGDQVEALEFKISENAPCLNIPLKEMKLKSDLIICGISRGKQSILPGGDTTLQPGDRVLVVTSRKRLNDFKDILK